MMNNYISPTIFIDSFRDVECPLRQFPFNAVLSLEHLIGFWEKLANDPAQIKSSVAKEVLTNLQNAPELKNEINDLSVLEKHKDILSILMSVIYPETGFNGQITASLIPYSFTHFYSTPSYQKLIDDPYMREESYNALTTKDAIVGKTIKAYLFILKELYNQDINFDHDFILGLENKETGLTRYHKLVLDIDFLTVDVVDDLPDLTEENIALLLSDVTNLKNWIRLLPPEKFIFRGFTTINAHDVTEQVVISSLKHDLLEREAIISSERFTGLQQKIRDFLRLPDIRLGLAAFPANSDMTYQYGNKIGESFALSETCKLSCDSFKDSVYEHAAVNRKPVIIEDIEKLSNPTIIEEFILSQDIRNLAVIPLYHKNDIIGVLELGSQHPGLLNSLTLLKMQEVISLFTVAVVRNLDEMESDIQAIIKEKCTAIHPSVEWRFRRAAAKLLITKNDTRSAKMEDIVFEKVFPLYGITDIKNSSMLRNEAIQSDLIEQLASASEIIKKAYNEFSLPALDEVLFRMDKRIKDLSKGLSSGDEVTTINFLQNEIDNLLNYVRTLSPELASMTAGYYSRIDPNLKIFYLRRRKYEESVTLLNEALSQLLEDAEKESQQMYPHYFEKYKTDGIEHSIYIGEALTENKKFHETYLRSIRLWQLMIMCKLAQKATELKSDISLPLEVTQMLLVHSSPLTIVFREDEKKFDVEGSYNIRYEIIKKRIDKAVKRGSEERINQPGKIAIVYSQQSEAVEYRKYIDYLSIKGFFKGAVEELELEDLQGVQGLKALRVAVNYERLSSLNEPSFIETANSDGVLLN